MFLEFNFSEGLFYEKQNTMELFSGIRSAILSNKILSLMNCLYFWHFINAYCTPLGLRSHHLLLVRAPWSNTSNLFTLKLKQVLITKTKCRTSKFVDIGIIQNTWFSILHTLLRVQMAAVGSLWLVHLNTVGLISSSR